jgi:hypothetical protein
MAVRTDESHIATFQLSGPGGAVCFAVGSPSGPRSSVWVIKAPPDTRDVYVGNMSIIDFIKISLHQSGIWRYALTKGHARGTLPAGVDRVVERWHRPPEVVPGWTEALNIGSPTTI